MKYTAEETHCRLHDIKAMEQAKKRAEDIVGCNRFCLKYGGRIGLGFGLLIGLVLGLGAFFGGGRTVLASLSIVAGALVLCPLAAIAMMQVAFAPCLWNGHKATTKPLALAAGLLWPLAAAVFAIFALMEAHSRRWRKAGLCLLAILAWPFVLLSLPAVLITGTSFIERRFERLENWIKS